MSEDWTDHSRENLDRGFNRVQERAKQAGREQRARSEGGGNRESKPLLTHISKEADMGALMYELPSSRLFNTVRKAEKTIYDSFQSKGVNVAKTETPSAPEKQKTPAEIAFMNFCKTHREGHIEGLKRVPQTELLGAILANAESNTDISAEDVAFQAAVTLEAAGDNEDTKNELRKMLGESTFWKETVVDSKVTEGLQIPGITEADGSLFPGATRFEIPAKEPTSLDSKLNPLFEKWRDFVAKSSETRAKRFIENNQPLKVSADISKAITEI